MSTQPPTARRTDLDDPALGDADATAVLERLASAEPLDPAVVERIRAERVTEDIRRTHGVVDDDTFQSLLDDEA